MALQLNQHSWQAEVSALDASDTIGSSRETEGAEIRWHDLTREQEGVAGGWKLRVSCGLVAAFNPSKQEAKGRSEESRP